MALVSGAALAAAPNATNHPVPPLAIDWSRLAISATGTGVPDLRAPTVAVARAKAKVAARDAVVARLTEAVDGLHVNGRQTVHDLTASDEGVKAKVAAQIARFRIKEPHFYTDGGVDYLVELDLAPVVAVLMSGQEPGSPKADEPPSHTAADTDGVILDARGLKVTRALAPRVLDEAGSEILGPASTNADSLAKMGVAAYASTLPAASKLEARVGRRPLTVKVLKTVDGVDLVVRVADAARLRGLTGLSKGRVVIVAP